MAIIRLGTGLGNVTTGWHAAGGPVMFAAWGTWDGATAKIQWAPDDGVAVARDLTGMSFTANTEPMQFSLPLGAVVRLVVSGGAGTVSLSWGFGTIQGT